MLTMKPLKKTKGYTHRIIYKEHHKTHGKVEKTFRTTQDALKVHLEAMNKGGLCFDIKVERLTD